MPAQLWYFVCVIANWLQNRHATKSDTLIHPWIVEEAQVVVKIESESEKRSQIHPWIVNEAQVVVKIESESEK